MFQNRASLWTESPSPVWWRGERCSKHGAFRTGRPSMGWQNSPSTSAGAGTQHAPKEHGRARHWRVLGTVRTWRGRRSRRDWVRASQRECCRRSRKATYAARQSCQVWAVEAARSPTDSAPRASTSGREAVRSASAAQVSYANRTAWPHQSCSEAQLVSSRAQRGTIAIAGQVSGSASEVSQGCPTVWRCSSFLWFRRKRWLKIPLPPFSVECWPSRYTQVVRIRRRSDRE